MYVAEMAERLDAMSSVKLGEFRSQLEATCMSRYTEELWYNETVSLWMTIYIYKENLSTVVEGYPKAPFSIATTPRCRGWPFSFS